MFLDVIFVLTAIFALIFASIADIKTREIPNWLTYSLITSGLSLRFLYSITYNYWGYFLYAILSLAIFFLLANIIYYTKQWGGGDAKLMLGLAAMFATSPVEVSKNIVFSIQLPFLATFFINLVIIGAIYGLIISAILAIKNKKTFLKELKALNEQKQTKLIKKLSLLLAFILIILISVFIEYAPFKIFALSLVVIAQFTIFLYFLIKAVERACLHKIIAVSELTEGDWVVGIYKNGIYQKQKFEASQKKIESIKKQSIEKVKIKNGLPFAPTFLFAFVLTLFYGNLLYLLA